MHLKPIRHSPQVHAPTSCALPCPAALQATCDYKKDREAAQTGLSLLANLAKGSREQLLGLPPPLPPLPPQLLKGGTLPAGLEEAGGKLQQAQAALAPELEARCVAPGAVVVQAAWCCWLCAAGPAPGRIS
jgi:hypothetical protein